jgi:sirohydrochlorin cobaltochelatase
MKNFRACLLVALSAVFVFASCSKDENETKTIGNKEGILLVTFGSSYPKPQETFANIEKNVRKEFSNTEIRWAYTSHIIRNILLKKGMDIDSPAEALKKMLNDGYGKIKVQSLHVIPGAEYSDLLKVVEDFKKANAGVEINVGFPLMYADEDMKVLATKLNERFKAQIAEGQAVVFMGHGTHHAANDRYARFQKIIAKKSANFIVGTVEAKPSLDDVIVLLEKAGTKILTVTPLMSVAGDHANNDMAGDEKDSWKTRLEAKGYTVNIVLKGLGDYDDVDSIWVNHLKAIK